jgi:hypothetical protein
MWYFSYGVEMNPEYLSGKLKVFPQEARVCVAERFYLNFDCLGLPYWDPSYASLGKTPTFKDQPFAQGVAYQIKKSEFQRLTRSILGRGHAGVGYQPLELTLKTLDNRSLKAVALVLDQPIYSLFGPFYPSAEYMKIIQTGAKWSRLSIEYQEFLQKVPTYQPSTGAISYLCRVLFLLWFRLYAFPALTINSICDRYNLDCPRFVQLALVYSYLFAAFQHEFLWKHIVGEGVGYVVSK